MIEWREILYLDEGLGKAGKREKVLERVAAGKRLLPPVYGIFLAQNPENLLEIISLNEFLQPEYGKQRTFYGIGLAGSRESAIQMIEEILTEVYRKTGDVQVRAYLYPDTPHRGGA